ncbi:MAG TPA: methyltransferase domain-containing protein [Dongiaceae bacterium]|nr:methyltransferase domain-containing protein [Dongiaceae bacterium]
MTLTCNVCGQILQSPLYQSPDHLSITTMNKLIEGHTRVYFCDSCSHLQTSALPDLERYYAEEYEINLASEDDDQLYKVSDGQPIYRAEHQADVLRAKINFSAGARVLDYGCAKSATMRKLLKNNSQIVPFLFDITDKYIPFWERLPKKPQWSVATPEPSWAGSMDVVLSFYALEHVADLQAALSNVRKLLKTGGTFYFIVPNVYESIADFIVADHINHFSKQSLHHLLGRAGFVDINVDDKVHDAAFVVDAKLAAAPVSLPKQDESAAAACRQQAAQMAQYWTDIVGKIRTFESSLAADTVTMIYGAGFYGHFIFSTLKVPGRIVCFVDQNQHLQGTSIHGKPVVSPDVLPAEVSVIFVALNPRIARDVIGAVKAFKGTTLNFFYL